MRDRGRPASLSRLALVGLHGAATVAVATWTVLGPRVVALLRPALATALAPAMLPAASVPATVPTAVAAVVRTLGATPGRLAGLAEVLEDLRVEPGAGLLRLAQATGDVGGDVKVGIQALGRGVGLLGLRDAE